MYERFVADKNSVDESWWPILEGYKQLKEAPAAQAPSETPTDTTPSDPTPTTSITIIPDASTPASASPAAQAPASAHTSTPASWHSGGAT